MQSEDKLKEILNRHEALEREYHSDKKVVKVGATVFAVLLVAFFGISLSQIKSHVDDAIGKTAIIEAENSAKKAAQEADDSLKAVIRSKDQAVAYAKELESISQKYKTVPTIKIVTAKKSSEKDGQWDLRADCPSGYKIVGGGCQNVAWGSRIIHSYPKDGIGWKCVAQHSYPKQLDATAYAICIESDLTQ